MLVLLVVASLLNLAPLDVSAFEIYYFDHPTCGKAEYKGDVYEYFTVELYENPSQAKKESEDFLNEVKANVAKNFDADIICGGKLETLIYEWTGVHWYPDHKETYPIVQLSLTFTGTAMKKTSNWEHYDQKNILIPQVPNLRSFVTLRNKNSNEWIFKK